MSYYDEVYLKRLNRYGLNYQERIQRQRERNFDNYLLKTLYRVDFQYNNKSYGGSLERYKQDYTETQAYLLTKICVDMPNGTVLDIVSQDDTHRPWMVWWLEQIEASGYNRYVMLKMTHNLKWVAPEGEQTQWGYFYGPGKAKIIDAVKSSTSSTFYQENDNLHMFVTPYNPTLKKDVYFEVAEGETITAYVVTDVDINSTPGVQYTSVDPTPVRSKQPLPERPEGDNSTDYYWLDGGK